ncbi:MULTISPECIES: LysE family translocator [Acidiphilium]|jgi:threonine/homoserine/homoserine lactone efflux protein|uniref:LysE family translocator n=1 Tax=Acidiphilium TaxID=522 RepID=UPI000460EEC9|nr:MULTISPECIES: LysE family translocator [Acidiphilium]KDM65932.1 putative lysine exporter protein [Acidiphilium sp. JA12-A1]MBS3024919.1 LysE family translocator [Acidiphilium multivorum]
MSPYALPLAELALANFIGMISPGPAFLLVSRAAAGRGRAAGFGLSLGVAIAATTWAAAACFGVALVMARFAPLYEAVQIAGGLYLVWIGISAWRAPPPELDLAAPSGSPGFLRAVATGAALNLGNPKIVIFFTSIFVALLPAHTPLWLSAAAIAIVGLQEVTWYCLVTLLFSRARVQRAYRRAGLWIERTVGTLLIAIGARILGAAV